MSQQSTRFHMRVPNQLKKDVLDAIANLGYKTASEFMRDVFCIVAYGEAHTPISEELPKMMSAITKRYVTLDDVKKFKEEFINFLSAPGNIANWLMASYRSDEEKFLNDIVLAETIDGDYQDNDFQRDYFAYTGHSMTPADARALVHAYYNDPEIRKTMRDYFTARQRQKLVEQTRDKIEEEA